MSLMNTYSPVTGPSAWRAEDVRADASWIYELGAADIAEIERAMASVKDAGLETLQVRSRHFPLPTLASRMSAVWEQLENGRGMAILRGIPIERYDPVDLELLYWGVSSHIGIGIPQNTKGDYIGRVEDIGVKWGEVRNGEIMRGYVTNATLPFHSDTGDVATLLCVRRSKAGGLTSVVSSTSIYNAILECEPEVLDTLFRGFYYSLRGESGEGVSKVSSYRIPVFSRVGGKLNGRYIRRTIETGAKMGGPALTDDERHALDVMDKHSNSEALRFDEDFEERERKRLMLRIWLQVPHGRELSREHQTLFGERTPFITRTQAMQKEGLALA
jgi:hypothetical protein